MVAVSPMVDGHQWVRRAALQVQRGFGSGRHCYRCGRKDTLVLRQVAYCRACVHVVVCTAQGCGSEGVNNLSGIARCPKHSTFLYDLDAACGHKFHGGLHCNRAPAAPVRRRGHGPIIVRCQEHVSHEDVPADLTIEMREPDPFRSQLASGTWRYRP